MSAVGPPSFQSTCRHDDLIGDHDTGAPTTVANNAHIRGGELVGLGLDAAHMLPDQERRLDHLAQLSMRMLRGAGIAQRVLVPEEPGLVAGTADPRLRLIILGSAFGP